MSAFLIGSKRIVKTTGKTIARILMWAIIIALLIITLALAVFRFAPQSYLSLVNRVTDYQVSATELTTELLPISLNFKQLVVSHADNTTSPTTLINAKHLLANVDWLGALSNHHNFWHAELTDSQVFINEIQGIASTKSQQDTRQTSPIALDVHHWLSLLSLTISNTRLVLGDDTELVINHFATNTGEQSHQNASDIKQNIDLQLSYGAQKKQLNLTGHINSQSQDGIAKVSLDLEKLNLDDFISSTSPDADTDADIETGNNTQKTQEAQETPQQAPDWSWLHQIKPTNIAVTADTLLFAGNTLTKPSLELGIDKAAITINTLTALVDWNISNDLYLKDTLHVSGVLSPNQNNHLDSQLKLNASDSEWLINGELNLTQPLKSQLELALDVRDLPLFDSQGQPDPRLKEHAQWLPVRTNMAFNSENTATDKTPKVTSDAIRLDITQANAGKSDVKGHILLEHFNSLSGTNHTDSSPSVTLRLESTTLTYADSNTATASSNNETDEPKASPSKQRLFSQAPIDWSWMNGVEVDALINIDTLNLNQLSFKNVALPLTLNKAQGLNITNFNSVLGDGRITSSLQITPPESGSPEVVLSLDADNIALDDLQLLDPKTLSGGKSQLKINVSSNGLSPADLAKNLNGNALLEIDQATIGNSAFEIIGSDLIGELISKLNPFLKSDPSTTLKCAVVRLPIENGHIKVNKSIAVETTKMVVVANGKINLENEKLKLGITPQSIKGIGLDVGSVVKFMELGGTLSNPKPIVGAGGVLKSGIAVGAAISTGGASILADSLISKMAAGDACKRARDS